LNLGAVANVVVEPKLMNFESENYVFDRRGDVSGWDEIHRFSIEVRNTREIPAKVEIQRNFNTQYWNITGAGDPGSFEKVDLDTVKFTLTLEPGSIRKFEYTLRTLRTYQGVRQENWRGR